MKDKQARFSIELTNDKIQWHVDQMIEHCKNNKEEFEKLSGEMIKIPNSEFLAPGTRSLELMSTRNALQYLINCLGITYIPDKFNHE